MGKNLAVTLILQVNIQHLCKPLRIVHHFLLALVLLKVVDGMVDVYDEAMKVWSYTVTTIFASVSELHTPDDANKLDFVFVHSDYARVFSEYLHGWQLAKSKVHRPRLP